jgi:glycosyltransferase involved in cell wall biosynthesis
VNGSSRGPRVLVIPSWYPTAGSPIAGSFFQEQAAVLDERYEMRVLYGVGRALGYREALGNFRLPPAPGRSLVRDLARGIVLEPPRADGFEYVHRSLGEPEHLEAMLSAYREKLNELGRTGWKPDLLHAQGSFPAGIVCAHLARELGVPWVLTEHRVFILTRYSEWQRKCVLAAVTEATELVAVSYHQLRCILMHGVDREASVVGNLIDETQFKLAPPNRDPSRFRILTVTHPMWLKDSCTFFHALRDMVAKGHRDFEAVVVGRPFDGPATGTTRAFEGLAKEYGVFERCQFIPQVARADMQKLFADCDVFVSTSVAETFGVAVREAMAVGRPVVCTASGGVEDTLSPVNGVKVNIRNHQGIADALVKLKTGEIVFQPDVVRDSVIAQHGRDAFLRAMSDVYDRALRRGPSPGKIPPNRDGVGRSRWHEFVANGVRLAQSFPRRYFH